MKILTKEQEAEHYNATIKGGTLGGLIGLGAGTAGVLLAQRRFPAFRQLTIPFRVFLASGVGTFSAIIAADRASARYETHRNKDRLALENYQSDYDRYESSKPAWQRTKDWAGDNRYSIVFGSWVASMGFALWIVRRNPYLTTAQKLVQARVYAQGLTIGVLLASFGLEAKDATQAKGRWETIKVLDPNDPLHKRLIEKKIHHERYEGEDQWMDVIAGEEQRVKDRHAQHEAELREIRKAAERSHNGNGKAKEAAQ